MNLIIEGKKEDAAKRLKEKYPLDSEFIDKIFSYDPTGSKYVPFIENSLSKLLKTFSQPELGLNAMQMDPIESSFVKVIPWFHQNANRLTPELIDKAAYRYQVAMDKKPENYDKILKAPKDITNYDPYFIEVLMYIVDSEKTEKQKEREAKSQVEKIFEDSDVLVVVPLSHNASCYYGSNTQWCTTTKNTSRHFDSYFRSGKLYYFINKRYGKKMALYINSQDKKYEVYDERDDRTNLLTLKEKFPEQSDLIDELTGTDEFIKSLKLYAKGKISLRDLEESDNAIRSARESSDVLGESTLLFDLDDDKEFFKIIDLSEDDQWFISAALGTYSDYNFYDAYSSEEDWKEGYIFSYFDEDNVQKLKLISTVILPNEKIDFTNSEMESNLSKRLYELFESQCDSIFMDFHYEREIMMRNVAEESVETEINDYLETYGFELIRGYDRFKTTVGNLIMWSSRLDVKNGDIIQLFGKIIGQKESGLGGWHDNQYEFSDPDKFNSISFNNTVTKELDNILEKLDDETSPDFSGKIKDFVEFRDRILSKFTLDEWYKLPKDKEVSFKIEGFDKEKKKIKVRLLHDRKGGVTHYFSEENFNHLLYQPELFEFGSL